MAKGAVYEEDAEGISGPRDGRLPEEERAPELAEAVVRGSRAGPEAEGGVGEAGAEDAIGPRGGRLPGEDVVPWAAVVPVKEGGAVAVVPRAEGGVEVAGAACVVVEVVDPPAAAGS